MLFNSPEFLFVFLPVVLIGYFLLFSIHRRAWVIWLVIASLFYYAYWDFRFLGLIGFSILANFVLARKLVESRADGPNSSRRKILAAGIVVNLALLGYFKYFNFFVSNIETLTGHSFHFAQIILPIGLSFFTFQQIALLVDAWQGKVARLDFWSHSLFISFFPQLIAGPIVHHSEVMPQFETKRAPGETAKNLGFGFSLFSVGLFKKVVIADLMARNANRVFGAADLGSVITFFDGWIGALSYTLEIYFDFSAYSDMALGLALLFGIRLPLNFNSPYQATSIIELWCRWHMTLSRFLRDYLYVPLGGNRKGTARRYLNLMATMLLGGLWHGAGWNFVLFGGLHGIYLLVNHLFRALRGDRPERPGHPVSKRFAILAGGLLTMAAFVFALVIFRAATFTGSGAVLSGMAGGSGVVFPSLLENRLPLIDSFVQSVSAHYGPLISTGKVEVLLVPLIFLFVWTLPNACQVVLGLYQEYPAQLPPGRFPRPRLVLLGIVSGFCLALAVHSLAQPSEFVYFQF